ncbi:class I glutamine amidotransferase-like protein [Russula emetica]|nr:class I glutamine amidotransferase-like protein [Russula emetica]
MTSVVIFSLVVTGTTPIPVARDAITTRGQSINKTRFTDAGLVSYDVLIFLINTGEVLDATGKAALQRHFDHGGNFVAIHSASDCLRNTTFYGREVGAFFDSHPALQNAKTVDVINASHPSSTNMLPAEWYVQDEMYNFKSDPRSLGAVVVFSANESSYSVVSYLIHVHRPCDPHQFDQGTPHPIAWYQEHGAGSENGTTADRSLYTSLAIGLNPVNSDPQDNLFLAHVAGGISWALKSNTTRAFNSSGQVGNGKSRNLRQIPDQSSTHRLSFS